MEFYRENSLARVSYAGGLIGLAVGSQFDHLQKVILAEKKKGWNLAEIIPESRKLIIWVLRFSLSILTLGLWTLSTVFILVFEQSGMLRNDGHRGADGERKRREPQLTDVGKCQ